LVYLFTRDLFLCFTLLLFVKVSLPCCWHDVMVCCLFSILQNIWLWVLLTGSGDGLCGPLPALLQAVAYHPPTVHVPAFPAICLLIVHLEISFLFFPPSLVRFQCTYRHPFHCVLVFSSLFIVQVFFGGAIWPGGYAGLSQGWLVEYCMAVGTHLFGLMNVS
jgi:hypothetical protein